MKFVLATAALAAVFAAPAFAQPPTVAAEGNLRVEGIAPDKVLGAIDTGKLVDEQPQPAPAAEAPPVLNSVTIDTHVTETPVATVATTTEVIAPISTRPAIDPANPIAPEVQAVVEAKSNYTTQDLVQAQLAAVVATSPSKPTTTITTTVTQPKDGG
jgi:hypothetical protein